MAETRTDADFEDTPGRDLPWLEPAELEYSESGGGFLTRKAIIVGGITIAVVVALLWWVADQFGGGDIEIPEGGEIPLVMAPEGPYRIAPEDPGGMPLASDELATHSVADGNALPGDVATDTRPEVPIPVVPPVGTGNADGPPRDLMAEAAKAKAEAANAEMDEPAPPSAAPPKPEPKPEPAPAKPAIVATTGGSAVQLGAFSTPAGANEAWDKISGRYPYVAALAKSVQAVVVGDKTLYRLRATGAGSNAAAKDICARLATAGETCVVP
ncbi:MAG: SPOR domain-containing protein [Pacificimonas sp.]